MPVHRKKNPRSFRALKSAIEGIDDVEIRAEPGEFETLIPEIIKFVGSSFSLVFIDPTGWTGLALPRIVPVLRLRGEVVINFMFDYVNRFDELALQELCGEPPPKFREEPYWRERELVQFYVDCVRRAGAFPFASYTRILKPVVDRTYFYLVYGTRHEKGLLELRKVESKLFEEQIEVRDAAKRRDEAESTPQLTLFTEPADLVRSAAPLADDRNIALIETRQMLLDWVQESPRIAYRDFRNRALEILLVSPEDVEMIVRHEEANGTLAVEGVKPRERTLKPEHFLVPRSRST